MPLRAVGAADSVEILVDTGDLRVLLFGIREQERLPAELLTCCTGERLSLTVCKLKNFENSIKEYRRLYLEVQKIGESLFNLSKKIYRQILVIFRQSEKSRIAS